MFLENGFSLDCNTYHLKKKTKEPELDFSHIRNWELLEFDLPGKEEPFDARKDAWFKMTEEVQKAFTGRRIRWFDGEEGHIESAEIVSVDGVHFYAQFYMPESNSALDIRLMKLGIGTIID